MTPSEAVIFRAQLAERHARYIARSLHKVSDFRVRGGAAVEADMLHSADLYVWKDEMLETSIAASRLMPSPVTYRDSLRPSPCGFYLFDRAVEFDGIAKPVRAIGWRDIGPLTMFWCYIETKGTTWADIGELAAYASFGIKDGVDVLGEHCHDWREVQTETEFRIRDGGNSVMRFLVASWLWINQRIIVAEKMTRSRQAEKLAARAAVVSDVCVVVLRRSARDSNRDAAGATIEWSHQWIVRGHWRQQFYPSTGDHRPLWIEPFLKGPEDKPFKVPSPTVFAVTR